jgi:hypothetical protein
VGFVYMKKISREIVSFLMGADAPIFPIVMNAAAIVEDPLGFFSS